jgi:autotransporter-associated beta strand protein
MKKTRSLNTLTKTLLVAASLLSVAPVANAYDQTGWYCTYGSEIFDSSFGGSVDNAQYLTPRLEMIRAGAFKVYNAQVDFSENDDWVDGEGWVARGFAFDLMAFRNGSNVFTYDTNYGTSSDNGFFLYGNNRLLPIQSDALRLWRRLDNSTDDPVYLSYNFGYNERTYQVARTGMGVDGDLAFSAFASDNQAYGSNYSASVSNRNILRTTSYGSGGVGGVSSAATVGSVVVRSSIELGNLGVQDGLYAKDAGWLDIRGSLTISGPNGQLYIRDAEVTSTIFTDNNTYTADQDRSYGNLYIESGILSVRSNFAQDMFVSGQQTVGFRDGAVNNKDINIDGYGYTGNGGVAGALRSISGSNVQNGDIGIGWLTGAYSAIGVDPGSTLTINGAINAINGPGSAGNVALIYNVDGTLVQNGNISGGVAFIAKVGSGTATLNAANTFDGLSFVYAGTLVIGTTGSLVSDATVYSGGTLIVNGRLESNNIPESTSGSVTINSGGTLKGSGRIDGDVYNAGTVAPGNSPGILSIDGSYISVGSTLDIELANHAGVAGTSYDQLRVGGTFAVDNGSTPANYSVLKFTDLNGFAAVRGDVFQVIADLNGNARNTPHKFDLVQYVTAEPGDRILFDHSTGKAYGTGLAVGTGTFRDYGRNANQREIGRALWMESIDYDKSTGTPDENFASTAIDPTAAAAQTGHRKTFILTRHDNASGEQATDLGLAAVAVLSGATADAGLDSISPEPYAGIADQGTKVARNFVRQTFVVRHRDGATDDWDFEVGYANDELTSKGTSDYNSYATKSNQVTLSASRTIGKEFAVTVAVGSDDGRVTAQNFNAKVKTGTVGVGITFTPDTKIGRFDIAAALSSADWDSSRGGALASEKGQHSLSVGGRYTLEAIDANGLKFTPYIGVAYARTRVKGLTEADAAGSVQLQVDDFKQQSLQSELGLNIAYQLDADKVLTGVVSWEHEFRSAGQTTLNSQFIETGVTDTRFTVNSNGFGADLFRVGLNLRYDISALSCASLSANALMGSGVKIGRELRANYSVRY